MLKIHQLLLPLFFLCFLSCKKETVQPEEVDCPIKAFYKGTNVCHSSEDAAAVQLDNPEKSILIISNFFELTTLETLEWDTELFIEYTEIDSALAGSGALCGAAYVEPVTSLTCLTISE